MKLAYLIAVHKNPDQIRDLVRAIKCRDNYYAVHCDRTSGKEFALQVREIFHTNVDDCAMFLKQRQCSWGGFSLIYVTLDGIRKLLEQSGDWSYLINLSGQCLPLRSQNEIREELSRYHEANFMEVFEQRTEWPRSLYRISTYWIEVPPLKRTFNTRIAKRLIPGLTPYGGSGWFILSRAFCEWLVTSPVARRIVRWYRHTVIADELVFQTLLMNSNFRATHIKDHKRFLSWSAGSPHPDVLTLKNFDAMMNSSALFARKFDPDVDRTIIDKVLDRVNL